MFRLFLQIEGSGVVIKQEGKIYANPSTGQLTTTFKDLPQLPTSNMQLHFNSGLRAGLATPQSCGTFTSTANLTPWSSPITPSATPESQFNVDWNGNGEACPAVWPFHPEFEAGTSNPNAGQFSPLTVTFNREDREQDFQQIKVTTPPGLLGSLSGVPLCGEPQADLGTCSAASQIGEMTVAAGPGSHPYYQKGMVYLTGPYKGAPFGLSIVVPTHAGPFNLGNVVVRARINVDPYTTALTVTTDPLPQILDGIPLRLRKTNVTINRPGFIFNPTDCAQQHITATISGSQGTQTEESTPFAVAGCAGLSFGPKFTRLGVGQDVESGRGEPRREALVPAGPAVEHRARQGRTPQAAALAADDAAEGLPGQHVRSEPRGVPGGVGDRRGAGRHADPAGEARGPGVLRLPRRRSVPEPRRRPPGLRGARQPRRRHVHLQGGDHELDVHEHPGRPGLELRAVPARGPLLRARREREPLQGQAHAADAVHRAGRRAVQPERPDPDHRLRESEEAKKKAKKARRASHGHGKRKEVLTRARTLTRRPSRRSPSRAVHRRARRRASGAPALLVHGDGLGILHAMSRSTRPRATCTSRAEPPRTSRSSAPTGAPEASFAPPALGSKPEVWRSMTPATASKGDVYVAASREGVVKLDSSGEKSRASRRSPRVRSPPATLGRKNSPARRRGRPRERRCRCRGHRNDEVDIFSSSGVFVSQFAAPGSMWLGSRSVRAARSSPPAAKAGRRSGAPRTATPPRPTIGPDVASGLAGRGRPGHRERARRMSAGRTRAIDEYEAVRCARAAAAVRRGAPRISSGVAVDETTDTVYAAEPKRRLGDVFGAPAELAEVVTGTPATGVTATSGGRERDGRPGRA